MLAGLFDHLWQATWICGCVAALAFSTRHCFAELRLWLWRIAALKFAAPFAVLFAIGQWIGFPVAHTSYSAPAALVRASAALTPLASPARSHGWTGSTLLMALALILACTAACALCLKRRLGVERRLVEEEAARRALDINAVSPRPGFWSSALLTACAISFIAVPLLAGAVDGRQRRLERLVANSFALRDATLKLTVAAPGAGWRSRVEADARGVSIHNVNIRQLVAIVYGVNPYAVTSDQMNSETDPVPKSWFFTPLYDLRATAAIPAPEDFDPYALRQGVTKLLADRFGLTLEMDGNCQPPCGKYGVPLSQDAL